MFGEMLPYEDFVRSELEKCQGINISNWKKQFMLSNDFKITGASMTMSQDDWLVDFV